MNKPIDIAVVSVSLMALLLVVTYASAVVSPSSIGIDQFAQSSAISSPLPSPTSTPTPAITPSIAPNRSSLVPEFSMWLIQSVVIAVSIFLVVFWRRLKNK